MKNLFAKYRFQLILVITAFAFFAAEYLDARAGGGGGYSSGRSSGGGSFGGGGGGGDGIGVLVYLLIRLAIQYPVIGIPLIIIVVAVIFFGSQQGHSAHVSRSIRKTYHQHNERKCLLQLNLLKKRDPNFDTTQFLERVAKAFGIIQEAWMGQEMKPARHLISDGVNERFSLQLKIQKASLIQNIMKDVRIVNSQIVAVESDDFFDTVHVRITASAVDYYVKMSNQGLVSGSKAAQTFVEYWSFLRRPGAQTLQKPGLVEGYCPNCGALLEMTDAMECASCKAVINSGEYDWVLAEITQEDEWGQKMRHAIPGLQDMVQRDPAFNIQHIEDKTSVMFYRYIAAGFFARPDYLSKMCAPEFSQAHTNQFKTDEKGRNHFYADAAVGCVEVVEISPSPGTADADSFDTIRLKVKWAGHEMEAEIPSLIVPDYRRNRIFTNDFMLKRKSGVMSSSKNVLTSSHCPGCGAPETINTNGACEYCQLPLNDGSADWVLCDIRSFSGYPQQTSTYEALEHKPVELREEKAPQLSRFDRESIIACATGILLADGEVDDREKTLLMRLASEKGIDDERLQVIINTVQSGNLQVPVPENLGAAKEFLRVMVAMCLADGKISSAEMDLLKKLVSQMNYTDIDIKQMIKSEKRRLHQQAKNYLYQG